MKDKIYSFRNENGDLLSYIVKEQLSVNSNDYIIMTPEKNKSKIEVYKYNYDEDNEALELVDDEKTIKMLKTISKVM
ncbi:hypothetical protein CM240_1531 [Clostridium bornimense]|uniref:DUF1292 domain-containing protein n=1 Tax=Clostridium bornimense TaxID=1216932 RepID=W6RYI7_9CLOT|nr:DUF1292 domain-containing protein [Clostridium bornimense]CDM68689.1 hypothetical protein CM240_1531 [Clostridium bornimense]